jgi:uncharacterized protein YdeI (YjbR/CyaY-like superfamily)
MSELATLDFHSRPEWRDWLASHHASSPGIWLTFYKEHTGVPSISYEDSVREALCFGWVDSLIKRLDGRRFARKFTPRKPTSKWSDSNRKRWTELNAAGLLTAAGKSAAPSSSRSAEPPAIPELPAYLARSLKASRKAWASFQALPPSHRRQYVMWIHSAKRPETRERRIQQSIAMLEDGKTLGLK